MSSTELKMFLRSLGNHDDAVVYQTVITDVSFSGLKLNSDFILLITRFKVLLKLFLLHYMS